MEDLNSKITELIIRFQNGDIDAFTGIYEETYKLVYTTCFGMLHNEDDAQDMTQEVYIKIYEKLNTLEEPRAYGRWMKMLATNMCLNQIKKTGRMNEHLAEDDVDLDLAAGEWEAFDSLPNSFIEDEEKREIINKVLKESLSEVQYQTIFMHYFGEMQLTEIARQMDCPEGTVKTRLMKAKERFKDALSKYVDENKLVLSAVPFLTRFFEDGMSKISIPILPLDFTQMSAGAASGYSSASVAPAEATKAASKTIASGTAKSSAESGAKVGFFSTTAGKIAIGGIALLGVAAVGIGAFVALNKKDTPVDNSKETVYVSGSVDNAKYLLSRKKVNGKLVVENEYDDQGNLIKRTEYASDHYIISEYDNNGGYTAIDYSNSTNEVISKTVCEFEYDDAGLVVLSHITTTNADGMIDTLSKFDNELNIFSSYHEVTDNFERTTTDTYEYDENGVLIKSSGTDDSDSIDTEGIKTVFRSNSTTTYEYDSNGFLVKKDTETYFTKTKQGDTSDSHDYVTVFYENDPNGKCLFEYSVVQTGSFPPSLVSVTKNEYEGDALVRVYTGRLKTGERDLVSYSDAPHDIVTIDLIKDHLSDHTIDYQLEQEFINSSETATTAQSNKKTEYDEHDNLIHEQYLDEAGNVTKDIVNEYVSFPIAQ